jgi:hypothetical protein
MNKIIVNYISLLPFLFFVGCSLSSSPSAEKISEISMRLQTGLLGSASTISFTDNGAARCDCTFYNLNENKKPNLDFVENICAELYRKNETAFVEQKQSSGGVHLKGIFTGKITEPEFENLAQTVRQSGFFQLTEKESNEVNLDAPPNFVEVKYEGKTKEVSDSNHDLSEIEGEILKISKETNWVREQK